MQLTDLGPDTTTEQLAALADHLERDGDVRGELLRLQLRVAEGHASAADRKRLQGILRVHEDDLLGPLSPFVKRDELVFRLGFPDEVMIKQLHPKHEDALSAAFTSPLVRRIRKLLVEVALVRDQDCDSWDELEVVARLTSTLAHQRLAAQRWLDAAITNAAHLPVRRVRLRVAGKQPEAFRDAISAHLGQAFGRDVELGSLARAPYTP